MWRGVLVISTVIACGIAVVASGVVFNSFLLMLAGRALYGLGGESLFVGVDVLATDWFKDHELGLAYGLIQSAGQAGSFAAFYGVPALTAATGHYTTAYVIGVLLAATSLSLLFAAHGLEQLVLLPELTSGATIGDTGAMASHVAGHAAPSAQRDAGVAASGSAPASSDGIVAVAVDKEESAGLLVSSLTPSAAHVTSSEEFSASRDRVGALDDSTSSTPNARDDDEVAMSASSSIQHQASSQHDVVQASRASRYSGGLCPRPITALLMSRTGRRLGLHHLTLLGWDFFAVLIAISTYSGCFYTFLAFGNDWLHAKYGMHADESGMLIGMISIFSCVLSPIAGLVLDKRGGREYAALAAMIAACTAFALMGFTSAPVAPCIVLAAIAYAILPSALYPLISVVVPEEAFTQVRMYGSRTIIVLASIASSSSACDTCSITRFLPTQVYAIINASLNALLMLSFYAAGE